MRMGKNEIRPRRGEPLCAPSSKGSGLIGRGSSRGGMSLDTECARSLEDRGKARAPGTIQPAPRHSRRCAEPQAGWGKLCHQMRATEQRLPLNVAWRTPSSTILGNGSPGLRETRLVPVDFAQTWNNSSDAT